ncbi:MFS transporter [Tumebacillus sp. ITR2]|uniref:MFS transporter n=2 Tax=Tumebacillus amylolyticus TaxID=2801339 RepID=A0ABS1J616_9BACL|nr:MFS transporter [Tumebacillus amylolyticus]
MLLPTLPSFVSQHGGTDAQVGLVIGILTLAAVIARLFVGPLIDSLGKKIILIVGNVILLISMGSYYWAASVAFVLGIRFLHGLGWGTTTTSYGALASDIIPASRRGEGLGYFGLGSTLAMALGPFTGIWVMKSYGFDWLFVVTFLSTLLSLVLPLFVSVKKGPAPAQPVSESSSLLSRMVEPKALFPAFLVLLLGVTYGGVVSFITLFGTEAGIANVGWFFLVNALSVFIVRPISGRIFDKRGHFWVLFPGAFFSMIGLLVLSYATTTPLLMVAALFYGIGFGSIQPSIQAWTVNRVAPNRRGVANATFYNGFDLGLGGGGMLLGMIAASTSYALMYRVSIVLMVIYLVVYLLYRYKQKEPS